jgi:hypothetical protein
MDEKALMAKLKSQRQEKYLREIRDGLKQRRRRVAQSGRHPEVPFDRGDRRNDVQG